MDPTGVSAAGAVLVAVILGLRVASRRRLRAQLGSAWARATPRNYERVGLLQTHRDRVEATGVDVLDDRTCADLNLDEVFAAIDRTVSTLGQQALYHRLRRCPDPGDGAAFEALVSRMTDDVPARERAQSALARLRDASGYNLWWLGEPDRLAVPGWYVAFPWLALIGFGLVVSAIMSSGLWPLALASLGLNIVVRTVMARRILVITTAFRQLAPVIATGGALAFLDEGEAAPIVRPCTDGVRALQRLKTIARWASGNPLLLPMNVDGAAHFVNEHLLMTVYEYVNTVLLLDGTAAYFGCADLRARGAALLGVLAAIGDVDAAVSVASFRAGTEDWTRPQWLAPGATAELVDIRHPLLNDAVANSVELRPGRGLLVTGSNMSGKSTFLRTVGVNAILAHTIGTCLARRYAAPVFTVRSCIGRSDDLIAGKSYYLDEVEALLALVDDSGSAHPRLYLLDELFRGTNAVERIAAGQAVLMALVGEPDALRPHVVIAATHDGELVNLLPDRYDAVHFGSTVIDDGLVCDYRLAPGPSTTRNALALLAQHGAPKSLLERAHRTAANLDRQRAGG